MNRTLLLSLCLLPLLAFSQSDMVYTFDHDGETREYEVHTPPGYENSSDLYPVVINMHGLGSDRTSQKFYSDFNSVADTANVIVVYPQGVEVNLGNGLQAHWNAGFGTGVDDVGFIDRMIDRLDKDYKIDYATGMSNGGYMSYYLACELEDRIAAIASVTGSMTFPVYNNCNPDRTVPIMQIHGTNDATVPFNGTPSITAVVESWVDRNMCDADPLEEDIEDIDKSDNTTTKKYTYIDCDDESEVWYYVVAGGGHTWPGAFPFAPLGNTSQDFEASEHIWWFFRTYEHPSPRITTSLVDISSPIKVFPNPTAQFLRIDELSVAVVEIISSSGMTRHFPVKGNNVDVSSLPSGFYTIKAGDRIGRFVRK